jgi:hypothetical protein
MIISSWILFRMTNGSDKVIEKLKTHILSSITFFFKLCRLWDNVEKYGAARGTTNYFTIWRVRVLCWISEATGTHAHTHAHAPGHTRTHTHTHTHTNKYVILIVLPLQQRFANVCQCYVIRTLPVLLHVDMLLLVWFYKVVQIWPGLFVCKQVTVCPGHIWTTLYFVLFTYATRLKHWTAPP